MYDLSSIWWLRRVYDERQHARIRHKNFGFLKNMVATSLYRLLAMIIERTVLIQVRALQLLTLIPLLTSNGIAS
jgi:hypothetical protein